MSEQEEVLPAVVAPPERLPRERTPKVERFRLLMAVLIGIGATAVAIAAAIVVHGSSQPVVATRAWSAWSPGAGGTLAVEDIASYVAPYYRFTTTQQLDAVSPIRLTSSNSAGVITGTGLTIALDYSSTSNGSSASPQLSLLTGKTVAYDLCGFGTTSGSGSSSTTDCSLPGTPSTTRLLLLRREALELALYTLKYVSGTSNVVVVMPPGRSAVASGSQAQSASTTIAVFFDRAELQPLLQVPISRTLATLPPYAGQANTWAKSSEATLVDEFSARGLFSIQFQSPQVGGKLMIMTPLPPQ